jgi:hypothetical protein
MSASLDLYLMTLAGLVKARVNAKGRARILHTTLDPDDVREVVADPFNPRRLYAATVTDIYASEDDGETWKYRPAGGLTYREICSWRSTLHAKVSFTSARLQLRSSAARTAAYPSESSPGCATYRTMSAGPSHRHHISHACAA